MLEVALGDLEAVEEPGGGGLVDAVVYEVVEDGKDRGLDGAGVFQRGQAAVVRVHTLLVVEVEVAERRLSLGGRAAAFAVELEEGALAGVGVQVGGPNGRFGSLAVLGMTS